MTTPHLIVDERASDEALLRTFSHAGDSVVREFHGLASLAARTFGTSMALVGYLEGERVSYPVRVGVEEPDEALRPRTSARLVENVMSPAIFSMGA